MPKISLILRQDEFTSFTSFYLESLWQEFFDIQIYATDKVYDKKSSLFVVWCSAADDTYTHRLKDQGYKIVIDNLWEARTKRTDYYWLENPKWWWWNESLWWRALGFHSYLPKKNLRYLALMPLRRFNPTRARVMERLTNLLPSMIYSCHWLGKHLPNDIHDPQQGQRYMHPDWYDQTYCSLVVETSVCNDRDLFVTEKSYKPLAYYHPFVSLSSPGTLKYLKDLGFETFDHIFDESYDDINEFDRRLEIILVNLRSIVLSDGYDKETIAKIQHNHQRFFSESICRKGLIKEIIYPMLEYAET